MRLVAVGAEKESLRCVEPLTPDIPTLDADDEKVIATAQWVLPQVDIYIGELSPFGASISFTTSSSRSNASGRSTYRHSKPNGGPTFGVVDESTAEDEQTHVEREEVQVKV